MARDLDRPVWKGQRPWFEIWFAVVLDEGRRRALWLRETLFIPRRGDGRATLWGAWFDADAPRPARAAKRWVPIEQAVITEREQLIRIGDSRLRKDGAAGEVPGLAWNVAWTGGRPLGDEVPAWVPLPTHAHPLASDADAAGTVTVDGETVSIAGKAIAMHLWGKRRVPTLHWIWSPWLAAGSLEVQAVSLRDRFAMGLASLRLDARDDARSLHGRPATAAHASGLVTSTVAGARRLVHARAWAEPHQMVGFAYRDTDDRDLMVAQSDIGSSYVEVYTRKAPGAPWHPADEQRGDSGTAVEIHQRAPLPDVAYIGWDEAQSIAPALARDDAPRADQIEWPAVGAIVALGLTYSDHVRETGQKLDASAPPTSFSKGARAFAPGASTVRVPASDELLAALDAVEPGLAAQLREHFAHGAPAVMDYEGEVALVALGAIDEAALAAGVAQPFGLAAANDLTSRFCQALGETTERPLDYWACAKSFPGFLPVAPRVWAPAGGLAALPELTLETRVNGELRQSATTKLVMYDLPAMVRAARAHLGRDLARGDVILTGTPAGVGLRLNPFSRRLAALVKDRLRKAELLVSSFATSDALLRPGDVVEVDAGLAGRTRVRLGV